MFPIQAIVLYASLFMTLFFEVFLLITYLEIREQLKFESKHAGKSVTNFPSTTIIVPCYNEERTIARTVRSILDLDYDQDKLSVILVDDGSTDGTIKEFEKFKDHPQVRSFTKENGGKYSALNFALERVDTDLVGCLDADSFVNSDALRKIVPYFNDETVMAVTPSIKVHEPKTILQYVQRVEYAWGIFLRRMLSAIGALYVTPGPFSIFRTKVFKEVGGYKHAHHTEDLEMALRLQKKRYKIENSHSAHVYTVAPAGLKSLYKQRVRWTYGFLNNAIDYRALFFNKKYGNIGLFILPIATISIFITLYGAGSFLMTGAKKFTETFVRWQTIGFTWSLSSFSLDWYFLNTGVVAILSMSAILLTLVIITLSLRLTNGSGKWDRGVIYYLALYVFIVPLWLFKALVNTVTRRNITWR